MPPPTLMLLLLSLTLLSTGRLCQAQNPRLVIDVEPSSAVEHTVVTLSCLLLYVEDDNTTFSWHTPDGVNVSHFVFSEDNRSLKIPSVSRSHDGTYACQAQLPSGEELRREKRLDVHYGPESLKLSVRHKIAIHTDGSATPFAVRSGESANLFCDGKSNPPMEIRWKKDSVVLETYTKNLMLSSIQLEHTGVYTCEGFNEVTGVKMEASIRFFLQEPVSKPWLDMDKTKILERSGSVRMKCNHKAIKECWYVWLWKGWPVPVDSDRRYTLSSVGDALELDSVWMGDAGEFQCLVQNNVSVETSDAVHLQVTGEDSETMNQVKVVVIGLGTLFSLVGVSLLVCFLKNKV
ncbi:carcinoembryonic antigen-related cell adhesion molecule 20-like [Lethenteron reissneri]|uniref:carcinoembryonic antigen-related cell adhesion molecule 20-like n=1 Tax=Lethenteron reissneri TaxID=7753 RepID=UPI002AB772EE|nr:carcinoembryonic antigen-related cell adhesion molecule 20-like [Lethenteron reissneri]